MLKLFGLIFISIIISSLVILLDYSYSGSFLTSFMAGDFIQTYATIFGFNIAAIIFLLGQLFTIERIGENNFSETKREIKHNAYYLLISFFITIVLFTIRPDYIKDAILWTDNCFFYIINGISLSLFIIALYAVFEILEATFVLTKK